MLRVILALEEHASNLMSWEYAYRWLKNDYKRFETEKTAFKPSLDLFLEGLFDAIQRKKNKTDSYLDLILVELSLIKAGGDITPAITHLESFVKNLDWRNRNIVYQWGPKFSEMIMTTVEKNYCITYIESTAEKEKHLLCFDRRKKDMNSFDPKDKIQVAIPDNLLLCVVNDELNGLKERKLKAYNQHERRN